MSDKVDGLPERMLANIKQLNIYVNEYCAASPSLDWCKEQLSDFHTKIESYTLSIEETNNKPEQEDKAVDLLELALQMRSFANEKFKVFQRIWVEINDLHVVFAITIAFYLLILVLLYGILDDTIIISKLIIYQVLLFFANIYFKFNLPFGEENVSLVIIIALLLY